MPGLVNSKDPNFFLGQTFASNPYIVFNQVSPNNGNALSKVAVRKALSEAISRDHLIQDDAGPLVSPPLTHILPAGISGTTSNTSINLYPYNPAQAKKDLAAAGVPTPDAEVPLPAEVVRGVQDVHHAAAGPRADRRHRHGSAGAQR